MTVNLSALGGAGQQFFDNNGNPLSGGKLWSYAAGTTTPQTTYTTAAGNVAHTNPIVLDSAGRVATGEIWLTAGNNYKFVLMTSTDVTLATWDNIAGIATDAGDLIYTPAANSLLAPGPLTVKSALDQITDNEDGSSLIGFIQSGTGAVAESVQDKLRQTVSVKDFGAVGDGVTDDTVEIQAAFTALSSNGSLYFPPGHYIVSESISTSATQISVYGEFAKIEQTGTFKKTFEFTDADQISVHGLHFLGRGTEYNGASTSYNGVAAIFFDNGIDCKVSNCQIERHSGGGIRYTDIDGLIVSNCTIIGIGAAGGITPLGNNGDAAIGVASAPNGDANVVIIGCTIKDHCFGVLASRRSGLVVDGCIIGPIPGQHGIYGAAKSGLVVTGCLFQDIVGEAVKNQIAASTDIDTSDCTIVGNTFRAIGQSCVAMSPAAGSTVGRFNNITVSSNTAQDIGNYFCTIRRCDGAEIIANRVYDCDAHPVQLEDFRGRITNNFIQNASWSAVYLQANGDCEISDNTFEDVCLNTENSGTASIRYQVMVYTRDETGTGTGHKIIMKQNTYRMTVSPLPAQLVRCFRSNSAVDVYLHAMHNETGLPMQIDSLKSQDIGYSPNADNTVSATLSPTTPLYGRGRRELFGTQDPASAGMTDTFRQGDICWSATPVAAGVPGWVCVTSGAPGTWKAMAVLAA